MMIDSRPKVAMSRATSRTTMMKFGSSARGLLGVIGMTMDTDDLSTGERPFLEIGGEDIAGLMTENPGVDPGASRAQAGGARAGSDVGGDDDHDGGLEVEIPGRGGWSMPGRFALSVGAPRS